MLRVWISRIRPEKEARVRSWLQELASRADEVRATFRDETVRAEQAYIIPGASGPLLLYVIEAEDIEQGSRAFAASKHKIDAEHKAVMQECLAEPLKLETLYDMKA